MSEEGNEVMDGGDEIVLDPIPEEIEEVRRSWQVRRRLVVVRRRVRQGLVTVFVLAAVAVGLISQTGQGQDLALRTALSRVRSSLSGQLSVDGVRSGTLLAGATLTGVRLDAADGRPFLTADSVVVRYSISAAIVGGRPIRSTVIWGLDLEISKYTSDQAMNVARLLAEQQPDTAAAGETTTAPPVSLGHVGIREGRVRILTPAPDPAGRSVIEGPEGEPLRELAIEALDLDVENAMLTTSSDVQFEARLASFSSEIGILDDPLVVDEVFGHVSYGTRGIIVSEGRFRLPGGLVEGDLVVGPRNPGDPWTVESQLSSDGWVDLADLAWIDPRIPEGRFRGSTDLTVDRGVYLDLSQLEVELEASNVVFEGRVSFTDEMVLRGMEVAAGPLTLERLEPWLEQDLPLEGWLSGEATFDGTLEDLETSGHVTLVPTGLGGNPTTADFSGMIHRGDSPGATDFQAGLNPLNFTVLDALWPDFPWAGTGSGSVELDGRVDDGLRVIADMEHVSDASLTSVTRVDGVLWRGADDEAWITEATVELRPLAVGLLHGLAPELGLRGNAWGSLSLDGAFDDLTVSGDLSVDDGRATFVSEIDLTAPASGYRLDLDADGLPLFALTSRLPDRTSWSGRLELEGTGLTLDSMDARVRATALASRVGAVRVDTVSAGVRVVGGILIADSLRASIGGVALTGRGRLGLVEGRWGSSNIDFSAESLVGLRPLVMGVSDSLIVRDELTALDREFLRLQGIEPDTLPSADDVRLEGRVTGSASVSGYVGDLDIGVIFELEEGHYKRNQIDAARVAFTATGLPQTPGAWHVGAAAEGVLIAGRRFVQGGFEAGVFDGGGEGRMELVRRPGEQYRAVGTFDIDSIGGEVELSEASIQIDDQVWNLRRPTHVAWDRATLTVDSLEIGRTNDDPMRLVVDGTLARGGDSDFRLLVEGLHAEQVLYVAQREDLALGGHIDLDVQVEGPSESPRIASTFRVDGPRYGAMELSRIDGSMRYVDQRATFDLQGVDGARTALNGEGVFPIDLAFGAVESRVLDEPMDIRIAADSLDAAIALSYVTSLREVLGTVSGDVTIRGTPGSPEPDGVLSIEDAEWSIEAIGVRHAGVAGDLTLRPDRTVDVTLSARGSGSSDVRGTVLLEPFRDPLLNLNFEFDRFLAVSRPDLEGFVSGSFQLGGRYTRPVAQGALTVDEGAIYVDELQRAVGIVDLSDPFLFDTGLAVDTTALVSQPLFAGLRNPFFDNLRVDVDLAVPRDTWLRSIDSNVEMSGELLVLYDRSAGDFVLVGELQAVRGSHRVLGRTFELEGGTISFFGRPGLNPDLDIQASSRIRRLNEPALTVNAQVEGTLVQPVVLLTTEEAGLAEEDLISYIVFGQASGALGGRSDAMGGLGTSSAVSSAVQGTVSFVGGALTNQAGSMLPLDYFSVQQSGGQSLGADYVSNTHVEFGNYVGDDLFAVAVIRPFRAGPEANVVAGVRVEWALTDDYNFEVFLEDRFLRSASGVLGSSTGLLENDRITGVFFFREWGYTPRRDPRE